MHLYIITRGIKNFVDQFITELQGKYVPFKYHDDKGNIIDTQVQVAVRPIQLWEIAFPEEHKDIMLATILDDNNAGKGTQHAKHKKFLWAIRKALGAEEIPEYKTDLKIPISRFNMETAAIGIKKDYFQDIRDGKRYNYKANEFCFEGL